MGTHTNIYFSDKNESLYFKYCYPNANKNPQIPTP
jgi:hypothetical protein